MPNKQPAIKSILRHSCLWLSSDFQKKMYHAPYRPSEQATTDDTTVYCIHGTGDRAGVLADMAQALMKGTLPPNIRKIVLVEFNGRGQGKSIPFFAEQLADQIKSNNDKKVILFGHSRGGLVATEFAERIAKKINVDVQGVITACTPFGGSHLAIAPATWVSTSVAQMQVNSQYLIDLKNDIRSNARTRFKFYTANADWVVNKEHAHIEENDVVTELDANNHQTILVDPALAEDMRQCLTDWTANPLKTPESNKVQFIPFAEESFYQKEHYNAEEIAQLHHFEAKLSERFKSALKENTENNISYEYSRKVLLKMLSDSLAKQPNGMMKEAGNAVFVEAQQLMHRLKSFTDEKKWNISIMLVISLLEHDQEAPIALKLLENDAKHHALGKSNTWAKLSGALSLLAGAAVISLAIISGLGAMPLALGFVLLTLGAKRLNDGTQSSLSLSLSKLAKDSLEQEIPELHLTRNEHNIQSNNT